MSDWYTPEMRSLDVVCKGMLLWTPFFAVSMAILIKLGISDGVMYWSMMGLCVLVYPFLKYAERTLYPEGIYKRRHRNV